MEASNVVEPYVLVLFYSRQGHTQDMAMRVCQGIEQVDGVDYRVRTVPAITSKTQKSEPAIPDQGAPYANLDDLRSASGLILGSPTRFGNMAAPLKFFLEQTSGLWAEGAMEGKPAGVFCSTSSLHGGQESTLLSMMLPLLHHGMVVSGIPYSQPELQSTETGGTPYGASHWSGLKSERPISKDEENICIALGKRVAELSLKLTS